MHKTAVLIIVAILAISCGGSKKVVTTTPPEPVVVIEEKVTITPPEIETDVIDTPELPDETNQVPPVEVVEEPEIIDDSNQYVDEVITVTTTPIEYFDHSSYNDLVAQYVSPQGNVNYAGFKSNWSILRDYIKALGENMPTDAWTKNDKFAYWMNAYNAMTVDLILRHQPLESIKDIKNPWDQRFWKLGDKYYNLNEIEHQILRKMGDARIHFGINCASFSCPPLLNEAFTAQKVDAQLDQLTRTFVNNKKRNTITANSIEVSKIFTWFAKDFKTNGTLIDFLNQYSEVKISPKAKKRYKDYDWTLNN